MNPILLFARPLENHNYKIYDTLGIKLLNRLRLSILTATIKSIRYTKRFNESLF